MKEELLVKIANLLEVDVVHEEDALSSFEEWDSLTAFSIIALANSDYDKLLSNSQLKQFVSVGDLVGFILE